MHSSAVSRRRSSFCFFNDTATTEIYTLSLHDALPIFIFTAASILLTIDWMTGAAGADWLIGWRVVQGLGAAFLLGNSSAILTDAFPAGQRGLALGLNNVVGVSGQFIGLVLGGVLAPIDWRL